MKRVLFLALSLGGLLASMPAAAQEEAASPHSITGGTALGTDYMYRGQSQTGNNPAISGTINYKYTTGGVADVYAGMWASSINFGGNIEIDWYGGLTGSIGDTGLGWEAGFLYYQYPGQNAGDELDFLEGHIGLSYAFSELPGTPSMNAKVHYSPDFQWNSDDALYYEGNVSFTLPYSFGLAFHVGHQDIDDNPAWGSPDWTEWNVYLSRPIYGPISVAVGYHDTNLSKAECFGGANICEGRAVLAVSAAF